MSSTWGKSLKLSIFGESHSAGIGVVLDSFPAGVSIDMPRLHAFMARRAPGNSPAATARREADLPRILSGLREGITEGSPICAVIDNADTRSGDYSEMASTARPGHADFTGHLRYRGYNDVRGGGHFSGRLTAPLVFAGGLCLQYLEALGIQISAHILSVADISDMPFDALCPQKVSDESGLSVIDAQAGKAMLSKIALAKQEGDSLGGVIECAVTGLPAGIGNPIFEGAESLISSIVFGIPAVKGIEFGAGFGAAMLTGSQNNDPFYMSEDGKIRTRTNRHGGILGGITSGMPLLFRAAFKPTPSIAKEQDTVDFIARKEKKLKIKGRHDPCIVPRAVPCIEAAAAVAITEMILSTPDINLD